MTQSACGLRLTIPLLLATTANAQQFLSHIAHADRDGVATWSATITTNDGDLVVEPGETATIRLAVSMTHDDHAEISALAYARLFVLDQANAQRGWIDNWQILNDLDAFQGDQTTTDGASLYNIRALQNVSFGPFTPDNPIDVIEFTWATDDYSGYTVDYETFSSVIDVGPHTIIVWATTDDWPGATTTPFEVAETTASFEVACAADMNTDGALDILDFIAFQTAWQAGDAAADCDASASFNILDFVCYQARFLAGCH